MRSDEERKQMMNLVGVVIKRERKSHSLTQEALAKKAGVSEAIISLLERNQRHGVSLGTLIRILRVFEGHLTIHLP